MLRILDMVMHSMIECIPVSVNMIFHFVSDCKSMSSDTDYYSESVILWSYSCNIMALSRWTKAHCHDMSSILRLREPHASADRLLRPLHQLCSGGIPIADAPPPLPPLESRGNWPDVQLARHCRPAHQERERVSRLNNSIVLLVIIILWGRLTEINSMSPDQNMQPDNVIFRL